MAHLFLPYFIPLFIDEIALSTKIFVSVVVFLSKNIAEVVKNF